MNTFILKNNSLSLEFDRGNGALVGITALEKNWKILDRPEVGVGFRLLIPLSEELRNNPVYGEKQILSKLDIASDQRSAVFYWDGVSSERGGKHDIKITLTVNLNYKQAIFSMKIENYSDKIIESIYCPYFGDLQHPLDAEWFKTFIFNYATAGEWNLWPQYDNLRGYFGSDYPVQFAPWSPSVGAPMSPYFLLRSQNQGLYVGVATNNIDLVAWHTELRPGYGSSIDFRLPEESVISGKEVVTRFAAVHLPYIQPGETRVLTSIAIEPFQGGWQSGVDIYKRWSKSWLKTSKAPNWANEPHAWQQIHINSPEDELRIKFIDLPMVGKECAKHGIKAIQLVGWNDGGQDQGNPSHNPDPRLGTWDELKEAISKIQSYGVKLILFAKFTWADRGTKWFRDDLITMAIKDPYGDYYMHTGYQYQTATQFLDINTKRLIPMCFLDQDYLELCNIEFKKMVELGADGILFDECQHHTPAQLCFDPKHGHRYGASVYSNDRKLIQNLNEISKENNPNFMFAGEACYDWEMETYHLSYFRSENKQHIPLSRYMQPSALFMTAVTGFNDRNMINQCLMYRYIISYEPYNFKGHLEDFPLTLDYGKKMDALRTELRDYFWDGEYCDEIGVTVNSDGKAHHPYSVFQNKNSGSYGLVICNYEDKKSINVMISGEISHELSRFRLVDDHHWQELSPEVRIPAQSAIVVI